MERHVLNLSKELVKRGHEVKVFTCSSTRQNEPLDSRSTTWGVEVSRFASWMSVGEFGRVWPGFAREVLEGGFDVIHTHVLRHPHSDLSMMVSKFRKSACVLTAHSPFHPGVLRGTFARALVAVYDNMLAQTTLSYFDRVIALTMGEAAALVRLGAPRDKISVIPQGVDQAHFEVADAAAFRKMFDLEGKDVLLSLGRINRTKGLDVLVDAFSKIAGVFPELVTVIAGGCTSPNEERFLLELKRECKRTGVDGRVRFTGWLNEDEKASAYEACAAFVHPSLYTPFGTVLLEAAAHGRPMIATNSGGSSCLVHDRSSGLLVPPGDATELAAAMLKVVTDKELAKEMGEEARLLSRRYSWERVAAMTEGVYANALAGLGR